jgi:hypothetical protein
LPGLLWSRRSVAELIHLHTGRQLSSTTVGHYLTRWNLTPTPISGPHAAALLGPAATCWLTWSRPVPEHLNRELMPPPGSFAAGPPPGRRGPGRHTSRP